ncbi:conserved hypothetical protein [Talaromyces stipitatus ATCC 10500]|uniref:Uncharacterized protein n=1 Tax=Talaromyces stipitatus (strain ATCC 10500 / CBS 375.48 / QM 6759 / NRRL 1006) TaxID=441959 RepID=B8MR88_TALSN|nr:uncharacterized protein TSTA_054910 [Talaromyces stipitatus ATCC 10500]EED12983.1 conserved hypothetical protein [Talaromyces stipitatus ATCC 10500]
MVSIFNVLILLCAVRQATATFSLNTGGPNWDYTSKDLADTTSQACKDAYSASIDCDDVLVGMVASLNPNFDPQASDLERLCTTTCSDSLNQYVKNVKAACDNPGDLAGVCDGNKNLFLAEVETVGEVLQYQYSQACAKNGSDYCYLTFSTSSDWAREDFPCNDTCAIQFYQNAHNQPGSGYFFSYMDMCNRTTYWEQTFAGGWETVVQCGDGGNQTTSSTSVGGSASAMTSSRRQAPPLLQV